MSSTRNELAYLGFLRQMREHGTLRKDRTGVGTLSSFGGAINFDLQDGFPLLTTKRIWFKAIATELLWFLRGDTDTQYLVGHGVHIWDANATPLAGQEPVGHVGPIYGKQWRAWYDHHAELGFDQITRAISLLLHEPTSRRILVSAWNVADLPYGVLPPCHYAFQLYLREGGYLDCAVQMRSADLFLGFPFNMASYALLVSMIAVLTGYRPGLLIFHFGDAHIYLNHLDQVDEQLRRAPLPPPELFLTQEVHTIDDFTLEGIDLVGYHSHPALPAPLAV